MEATSGNIPRCHKTKAIYSNWPWTTIRCITTQWSHHQGLCGPQRYPFNHWWRKHGNCYHGYFSEGSLFGVMWTPWRFRRDDFSHDVFWTSHNEIDTRRIGSRTRPQVQDASQPVQGKHKVFEEYNNIWSLHHYSSFEIPSYGIQFPCPDYPHIQLREYIIISYLHALINGDNAYRVIIGERGYGSSIGSKTKEHDTAKASTNMLSWTSRTYGWEVLHSNSEGIEGVSKQIPRDDEEEWWNRSTYSHSASSNTFVEFHSNTWDSYHPFLLWWSVFRGATRSISSQTRHRMYQPHVRQSNTSQQFASNPSVTNPCSFEDGKNLRKSTRFCSYGSIATEERHLFLWAVCKFDISRHAIRRRIWYPMRCTYSKRHLPWWIYTTHFPSKSKRL